MGFGVLSHEVEDQRFMGYEFADVIGHGSELLTVEVVGQQNDPLRMLSVLFGILVAVDRAQQYGYCDEEDNLHYHFGY
jgi:cytoplasmic iron level regulating protein YaaA (DUF328/UPF0246 family)